MTVANVGIKLSLDGATQAEANLRRVEQGIKGIGGAAESVRGALGSLAGAFAGVVSVQAFVQAADAVTVLQNQLKLATGSTQAATQAYNQLFEIAQRSRVSFTELGGTFASIARASESLGLSQQQLLQLTETIGNAVTVSGASAQASQAALVQLSQGLASGVLRGEELNSILEQTPRLARALADGLGVSTGALRELGKEGKLTAEAVIGALQSQAGVLAQEVKNSVVTVGQAFTQVQNSATRLVGEIDRVGGTSNTLAGALQAVSGSIDDISASFRELQTTGSGASSIVNAISIAFETVAVLGVNVAFVIKTIGQEIVVIARQAAAVARLEFAEAERIGAEWQARAEKNRRDVDALSERIIRNGQISRQVRSALEGVDTRAEDARLNRQAAGATRAFTGIAASAAGAKKAVDEFTKSAERGLKLYGDLVSQQGGLAPDFAEKWQDLANAYAKGSIGLEQLTAAQAALLAQQPVSKALADEQKAAMEAQAKAAEALAKAEFERVEALERNAASAQEQLQRLLDEERATALAAEKNISLAQAIEEVAIARLREQQAALLREGDRDAEVLALQREIDARKELVAAIGRREARETARQSASDAAREWERAADNIERSLTDALLRGFESGKDFAKNLRDTIVNMFKTMVLRPVIQFVVGGISGSLGLPGVANAAQSVNSLSSIGTNLSNLATGGMNFLNGSTLRAGASGLWQRGADWLSTSSSNTLAGLGDWMSANPALGSALGMAGNAFAGYGISRALSGGYSTGGNTVNVIAGIASAFLGPIAGVVGGLVNRAFGRKAPVTTGSGITGTFSTEGANVRGFQDWFQKGGWFRSNKSGTNFSPISLELDQFLDGSLRQVTAATKAYASVLGLNADAVNGITQSVRISLKDLNAEQQQKAITDALAGFGDRLASAYVNPFRRTSETASDALARLATSLVTVNRVFDTLNQTLLQSTLAGGNVASELLDTFGGPEAFAQATNAYFMAFYSETERAEVMTRQLTATLRSMGLSLPATRDQFRALVEAQDLTTTAGRNTYAALLQLAPAFAQVAAAAGELGARLGQVVAAAVNSSLTLVEQQIQQSQAAAAEAREASRAYFAAAAEVRDASRSILFGIGNVAANLTQAYRQTLAAARGGDLGALEALPGRATDMLAQVRQNSTTSSEFALASARVAAELESAARVADATGANRSYQAKLFDVNTAMLEVLREDLRSGAVTVERLNEQLAALRTIGALIDGSVAVQTDTLDVSEIAAIATQENGALLEAVLGRLGVQAGAANATWSERLVAGNSLIADRLDVLIAAVNQQSAATQAELRRQQDLQRAQAALEATVQRVSAERESFLSQTVRVTAQNFDEEGYRRFNRDVDTNWLYGPMAGGGWRHWLDWGYAEPRLQFVNSESDYSQTLGQAHAAELERQRQLIRSLGGVPAFAMGGMHTGGFRLVGERGPEIEATGPARYWSFEQTQQLMNGTRNDGTASEVRALREENRAQVRAMVQLQQRFTKLLERWDAQGMPDVRVEA